MGLDLGLGLGLVPWPDLVDEGERVAGDLRDLDDLAADGCARAGVDAAGGEAVEAGVLVGERGAAPGLHVAEVPLERGRPGAGHPGAAHLLRRVAEVAHAVRQVLQPVPHGAAAAAGRDPDLFFAPAPAPYRRPT